MVLWFYEDIETIKQISASKQQGEIDGADKINQVMLGLMWQISFLGNLANL
jgi:hypothetical protein